ncbi:NADH:ubiquinone oxidoreductase subunit 5 (chain L)/Multisubunit Na+/H+ antiporter, MnhA subunit [Rhodopirellula islandica]|uniref:NADH:ubiquinone oxidoreductase subunit 5 (Chain L)/Multisubunit Na+/H+ antiporter, MnhA subunit n=1 Tax=Rhodopirellula islandica TaxID=595434 RepID=A0A0J1BHT9_RHOIS|nr:GxxExxY protein [Rhodopirellula islandica]KLU06063.1 NADH:ubiquinone oxidoreductase subunit 5 (chain L)/Multisubunit Na+/H+ antiporter, MnhA subunit [Rhodopirellula islandica]
MSVNQDWSDVRVKELCDRVRQIAYDLHVYLGTGYLEKIYENGLLHRLAKAGIRCEKQVPVQVLDDDQFCLGEYKLDLVVEEILVVEIKAARGIDDKHVAQILGYPKATTLSHGLLVNFGSAKFQIRKFKM